MYELNYFHTVYNPWQNVNHVSHFNIPCRACLWNHWYASCKPECWTRSAKWLYVCGPQQEWHRSWLMILVSSDPWPGCPVCPREEVKSDKISCGDWENCRESASCLNVPVSQFSLMQNAFDQRISTCGVREASYSPLQTYLQHTAKTGPKSCSTQQRRVQVQDLHQRFSVTLDRKTPFSTPWQGDVYKSSWRDPRLNVAPGFSSPRFPTSTLSPRRRHCSRPR